MLRTKSVRFVLGILGLGLLECGVAQAAGPYQFFSVTPCRVADTRNAVGPSGGPALTSGAVRSFPVAGICGIPSTAKAAALNVTLVGPTQDGFITIWPFNTTMPGVS